MKDSEKQKLQVDILGQGFQTVGCNTLAGNEINVHDWKNAQKCFEYSLKLFEIGQFFFTLKYVSSIFNM